MVYKAFYGPCQYLIHGMQGIICHVSGGKWYARHFMPVFSTWCIRYIFFAKLVMVNGAQGIYGPCQYLCCALSMQGF
jgi:hypothetical protein